MNDPSMRHSRAGACAQVFHHVVTLLFLAASETGHLVW